MSNVVMLPLDSVLWSSELTRGVDPILLDYLEDLQEHTGRELVVHCLLDLTHSNPASLHRQGKAADWHVKGMTVVEMFLEAVRFNFGGIGIYSPRVWHNPGLHTDTRNRVGTARAFWACEDTAGVYTKITESFLRSLPQEPVGV